MFESWMLHLLAAQDMGEPLRPAEMLACAPRRLFRRHWAKDRRWAYRVYRRQYALRLAWHLAVTLAGMACSARRPRWTCG